MPRRKRIFQKNNKPDIKYHHPLIQKFINCMMKDGKKHKAETLMYSTLDKLAQQCGKEAPEIFITIIDNVRPLVEVRSRRVGGATYQVPMEVRPSRSNTLAIKWLIKCAIVRKGKSMEEKLVQEMLEAYNAKGAAVKKKEDTHKMAEANKAFAHYRW